MKIVALHTDFRIYWPARLKALSVVLKERGDILFVIEIAGKGSPYSFAQKKEENELDWHILFPNAKPEELNGKKIEKVLFPLLDKIKPDVIIAGAIAFPSGALAVRYGQLNKTKIIVFDDSKIEAVKRNPVVNFIKQAVYSGVDAMFYPAEPWIPTGEFWGFNKNNLFFGVDVVDNKYWSNPQNLENSYGNFLLCVGRQIKVKNFDKIIKAYSKYIDAIGHENAYKLILIGDGPERNYIENLITKYEIQDLIIIKSFMNQKDLISFYSNASGFILNSSSETWGLVINEAMASGCPIFASIQCGATETLVKPGINGYNFDCNDIETLSKALIDFHNLSSTKKKEMGNKSKEIISNWGLPKFVDGTTAAIDFVCKNKKRKTSLIDKLIISKWKGQYRPI